jgi:hypothetical protein
MATSKNKKRTEANRRRNAVYRARHNRLIAHRKKKWVAANIDRVRLAAIKRRAQELGVPFDLTAADIRPPKKCPILKIELVRGVGHARANSASVHRIQPGLGYVRGNVRVLSHKANAMLQDATPAELMALAAWVQRTYGPRGQRR